MTLVVFKRNCFICFVFILLFFFFGLRPSACTIKRAYLYELGARVKRDTERRPAGIYRKGGLARIVAATSRHKWGHGVPGCLPRARLLAAEDIPAQKATTVAACARVHVRSRRSKARAIFGEPLSLARLRPRGLFLRIPRALIEQQQGHRFCWPPLSLNDETTKREDRTRHAHANEYATFLFAV